MRVAIVFRIFFFSGGWGLLLRHLVSCLAIEPVLFGAAAVIGLGVNKPKSVSSNEYNPCTLNPATPNGNRTVRRCRRRVGGGV